MTSSKPSTGRGTANWDRTADTVSDVVVSLMSETAGFKIVIIEGYDEDAVRIRHGTVVRLCVPSPNEGSRFARWCGEKKRQMKVFDTNKGEVLECDTYWTTEEKLQVWAERTNRTVVVLGEGEDGSEASGSL